MREFCALYEELDGLTATGGKVAALASWFARADPHDAAWALHCLLGRQRRRWISGRRLRQICLEGTGLPEWLFDSCYRQVGDTAETIALLWPRCRSAGDLSPSSQEPLHHWMETLLPRLAALEGPAQAEALHRLWSDLAPLEVLVCGKLLSGALRVGVAEGLVMRSLAQLSGLEDCLLRHRLMGGFRPGPEAWRALVAPAGHQEPARSRPYPFFLASPLPAASPPAGDPRQWQVEGKWDGSRGQLIQREGEVFLWSRREELLNAAFPELAALGLGLPPGTVLDGEVLVWRPCEERPRPFGELQRRLGRRAPGAALLLAERLNSRVSNESLLERLQRLIAEAVAIEGSCSGEGMGEQQAR